MFQKTMTSISGWVLVPALVGAVAQLCGAVLQVGAFVGADVAAEFGLFSVFANRGPVGFFWINILIVPTIETLFLAAVLIPFLRIKRGWAMSAPIVLALSFIAHGGNMHAIHAGVGFVVFAGYYLWVVRQNEGILIAITKGAIAHAFANTISLIMLVLKSPS